MSNRPNRRVTRLERDLNMQIENMNVITHLLATLRKDRAPMIWRHTAIAAFLLLSFSQSATAQDWTQWRGPSRDGLVPAASTPSAWPESLRRLWRVEIGEGYASPVVSRGRVFIHGAAIPKRSLPQLI